MQSKYLATKNPSQGRVLNLPSTGIEPVTFPMSRERATAAPTGLKITQILLIYRRRNQMAVF